MSKEKKSNVKEESRHYTVAENIKLLVQTFPYIAENYNQLHYFYWFYIDGARKLKDIVECTPAETIRRNFQRLVQKGEVQVPERVKKLRREKEEEYRYEFSKLA